MQRGPLTVFPIFFTFLLYYSIYSRKPVVISIVSFIPRFLDQQFDIATLDAPRIGGGSDWAVWCVVSSRYSAKYLSTEPGTIDHRALDYKSDAILCDKT